MKIYNNDNNTKKIYIQVEDIIVLNRTNIKTPDSINKNKIITNYNNKSEFIEFTNTKEINFFNSQDWIIDYKKEKNKTNTELKKEKENIINKMNKISDKINQMNYNERNKTELLINEYNLLNYQLYQLKEIIFINNGLAKINLPIKLELNYQKKKNKIKRN